MKKIIFFFVVVFVVSVFMAIHFCFPPKARAEERSVAELQRRVIINLCETNASLADRLNQRLENEYGREGIINVFFDKDGRDIGIVPTGNFFLMIKDLTEKGGDIKYDEVIEQLIRHSCLLEEALRNGDRKYFFAARIK
ncbi:MAG: hypothetical protein Q8O59_01110 [bacterium]|nr:hypothetical protein [bacterium]